MKKLILLFILAIGMIASIAANRTGTIKTGMTMLAAPMSFGLSDTIDVSDSVAISVTNLQKYMQHQTFSIALATVSGSPSVSIKAYGKVTTTSEWVQIGSTITWTTAANNGDITSTTPINYNYFLVTFVSSGAAQKSKITSFVVKTSNVYDIPANSGTLTVSRATSGTVTITSQDNDVNAALTVSAGGTGALTVGDSGSTTAITSSDWAIGTSGVITGVGNITSDGVIQGGYRLLAPVLNTDGSEVLTTVQSGKMIIASKSDGATTVSLPDPSSASVGVIYYVMQTADQNLIVDLSTANGNFIVCDGVATSDKVTIDTVGHKIGAGMIIVGISATQWYVGGLNPESVLTPEAAD